MSMLINKLSKSKALATLILSAFMLVPSAALSVEFVSSKSGERKALPASSSLPVGSVAYTPNTHEVLNDSSRTRTCAQVYGTPGPDLVYSGGPIKEIRYLIGYVRNDDGSYKLDANGDPIEDWSAWERTNDSLNCLRHYTINRDSNTGAPSCPPNQEGTIFEQREYTMHDDDTITDDTGWVETSRDCDYFFTGIFETQTQTRDCPANQDGLWIEERQIEVWSDGSLRNPGAWTTQSNTCDYYKVGEDTETRDVGCASGQTGSHMQERTFDVFSDGSHRNHSGWSTTQNTCAISSFERRNVNCPANQQGVHEQERPFTEYVATGQRTYGSWFTIQNTCAYYRVNNGSETRSVSCPSGFTGSITQRRTFENWSDGSKRNYSAWNETGRNCTPNWEYQNSQITTYMEWNFAAQYHVYEVYWNGNLVYKSNGYANSINFNNGQCLGVFGGYEYCTNSGIVKTECFVFGGAYRTSCNNLVYEGRRVNYYNAKRRKK